MGRFARKYPAEQIEACALAVLDGEKLYGRRIYPRDAVAMALAGELHGHGHFEITKAVVQKAAGKLRKERTGQAINYKRERGTLEDRLEQLSLQRVRILEYAQDRIEAKAKRGDLTVEDVEKVKRLGLAEREIRARAVTPASRTGTGARRPDTKDPTEPEREQSELVRRMRQAMAKEQHHEEQHNGRQHNGDGDAPASSLAGASVAGAGAGQGGATVADTVAT